jgi:uncharacterized protein involved in exopolysaccharide biosynthesis
MTTAAAEDVSLDEVLALFRRHWRRMVQIGLVAAVAAGTYALVRPRTWRATASFMPQVDRPELSGLVGLAAQFGVQVPQANPANSPVFYMQLLQSREILQAAVASSYEVADGDSVRKGSLIDLFEVRGRTPELRTALAVEALQKRIGVMISRETGVVKLSVDSRSPTLSRDVAAKLIALVQDFNRDRRAGQARAEREFAAARLTDAERELRAAEDAVRAFQSRNRDFRGSPFLQLDMERLQREVTRRQMVYNGLSQSFEQARLEEVRNTPVIAMVELPELPARPRPRGALLSALVAFLTMGVVLFAWYFVREVVRPRWRQRLLAIPEPASGG